MALLALLLLSPPPPPPHRPQVQLLHVLPVREAILWRRAVKQQQQLHADAAAQEASCHRFVVVLLCATFDHIVVNCSVLVVVPFSCIVSLQGLRRGRPERRSVRPNRARLRGARYNAEA